MKQTCFNQYFSPLQEAKYRAKEARSLWLEREAALQGQKAHLELARQQQEKRKHQLERLAAEAKKLESITEGSGKLLILN